MDGCSIFKLRVAKSLKNLHNLNIMKKETVLVLKSVNENLTSYNDFK